GGGRRAAAVPAAPRGASPRFCVARGDDARGPPRAARELSRRRAARAPREFRGDPSARRRGVTGRLMRRMAAAIVLLAALATPARAADRPAGRVDAQMLLDLDLLADGDPARHRDQGIAERMRMLDRRLLPDPPAPAPPADRAATPAARPPATPTEAGPK